MNKTSKHDLVEKLYALGKSFNGSYMHARVRVMVNDTNNPTDYELQMIPAKPELDLDSEQEVGMVATINSQATAARLNTDMLKYYLEVKPTFDALLNDLQTTAVGYGVLKAADGYALVCNGCYEASAVHWFRDGDKPAIPYCTGCYELAMDDKHYEDATE